MDMTTPQFQQALMLFSALSVVSVILAIAWPWIASDRMAERMKMIEQGRRKRDRGESSLSSANATVRSRLFAREPNRIFAEIVERLGLARLSDESGASQFLRMAGLRGRAPLVTYLAARVIAALAMPGLAFAYIGFVVKPDMSLPMVALMASLGAPIGFTLPKLYVAYSTACGHLFHAHVASHSMTCGHPREVICEAVSS